jgi:hypothetical protein
MVRSNNERDRIMRQYLPTFAELIDRLSIVLLKSIFIPENKEAYEKEQELILHDIDDIIQEHEDAVPVGYQNVISKKQMVNAKMIRAILVVMLTNRFIWENESKARQGGSEQDKLLKLTHSINGVRNTAKNVIAQEMGERVDLKVDALAAELTKEFGNWNVFTSEKK